MSLDTGLGSLVTDLIASSIIKNAENTFILQGLKREILNSDLSPKEKLEEIKKVDQELRNLSNAELRSTLNNVKKSLI